jgi:RsiW-degrading membrane proteinase PrsW (M82 family)
MGLILLVILAVAPPIGFLIYILRFDRIEPEPLSLVLKMLFLGCLAVVPAALIEMAVLGLPVFSREGVIGSGIQSFLVVAPVEEGLKLLTVMLFAWRNRNFNERNDGIVYAATVSIGFAMAENLFYVLEHGFGVGIARALSSIPGHTFTGVIMGYFIGHARFAASRAIRNRNILGGFGIAWFLHGAYNTLALSGTAAALLVVPLVVALFLLGIRFLRKGRALSAGKWGAVPAKPPSSPSIPASRGNLRKVAARILLILSGVFWLLLLTGILLDRSVGAEDTVYAVFGGLLLTALPITVGVLMEVSCGKRRATLETEKA